MDFSRFDHDEFPGSKVANKPKVSVCLITYKHENYIEKCLDSILEQQTSFDFEIVVGEDHSPDNTAKILEAYAQKHPEKIRAFIRPKNIGAKFNFLHTFFASKGDYIVHIEGDDYFCDPNKLQTQVEFLEQNPSYSACFHNAIMQYEDEIAVENHNINPPNQKAIIHSEDFLQEKETWFMATASVMMRRKFVETLPEWFLKSKSGDIPLYVILAEQGPIGYIDKVMTVYRRHLEGMSFTDSNHQLIFLQNRVFMYSKIGEYTKGKYKPLINSILGDYYLMYLDTHELKNYWIKKFCFFLKAFILLPKGSNKKLKEVFKSSLLTNFLKKILKIYLIFRR